MRNLSCALVLARSVPHLTKWLVRCKPADWAAQYLTERAEWEFDDEAGAIHIAPSPKIAARAAAQMIIAFVAKGHVIQYSATSSCNF